MDSIGPRNIRSRNPDRHDCGLVRTRSSQQATRRGSQDSRVAPRRSDRSSGQRERARRIGDCQILVVFEGDEAKLSSSGLVPRSRRIGWRVPIETFASWTPWRSARASRHRPFSISSHVPSASTPAPSRFHAVDRCDLAGRGHTYHDPPASTPAHKGSPGVSHSAGCARLWRLPIPNDVCHRTRCALVVLMSASR